MTFFAFGLNHRTAPVSVRETFSLDKAALGAAYGSFPLSPEAEVLILSTCNRTEVYLYGSLDDVTEVKRVLAQQVRHEWPEAAAFFLRDEEAVLHVFEVTVGLRSLVLGDAQILAQVKDAYRTAMAGEHVGPVLHRLMHTAFRTAKRVINETALNRGGASVPAAAVNWAKGFFAASRSGCLAGSKALVIGTGQMGSLALEALRSQELAQVMVTNRSLDRAQHIAHLYDATLVSWEDRYQAIQEADLILVASGAEMPVLLADQMPAATPGAPPKLIIDVAVPRNVDPAIDGMTGYHLIDLDALNTDLVQVETQRRRAMPEAQALCREGVGEYVAWVFHHQALQPAIQAIRESFEVIRLQEIERHHNRFSDIDRAELDRLTTSIIQKLLAVPVVRLKNVDANSIDFVRGIKLLHALFSRTACEEQPAVVSPAQGDGLPAVVSAPSNLPEGAARCPFEPVWRDRAQDPVQQLHEALRLPFNEET